jgi:crotonobetainyl-CoA:carnitine CoA-transferase CaiB-like acyl-CoA transferase
MADILDGVKIVEMGHVVAIPAASSMMGDCGAQVIKVEPLTGDQSRHFRGKEVNPGFYLHNRSKKSIAIDLRQDAGRDIVYKLVKDHDVFMTNYQAGSLKRLGMDYETLREINPRLIYGLVSAYGTVGPDKDMAGYDFAAGWARSGIQDMLSVPGSPPPSSRPGIIDRVSSMQIFGGIAAALYHREKTGEGQKVEFNLYHTGVWMVGADIMDALFGLPLRRVDPTKSDNPFYDTYQCKDGRWLQLTAADRYAKAHDPSGSAFWTAFCRAIERPDLADDPRFATTDSRQNHRDVLAPMLNEVFASKTYAEWEVRLRENDLMYGPILSPTDVIVDPQALVNDFFAEVDQPDLGAIRTITTPFKFCENPASIRSTTPALGEHTDEILASLGYSAEERSRLREQRVVLESLSPVGSGDAT